MIARQGDVLILSTTEVPKAAKPVPKDKGRTILAYGEVTGHAHEVVGECSLLAADVAEMADRFLRVEQECRVVHQEHSPVLLPPGDYIVRRQSEYTEEAARMVAD